MENPAHASWITTIKYNGFTLVELLITMAIFVILITLVIPSFSALIERSSISSTIHLLRDSHAYARLAAVQRQQEVRICSIDPVAGGCSGAASGGTVIWNVGLLIFIDEDGDKVYSVGIDDALRRIDFPDTVRVQWNGGDSLTLNANGSGKAGTFRVFTSTEGAWQSLVISSTGRARTEK